MGSTALEIISEAYRHHNLNDIATLSNGQEFPYSLAKDILNEVIRMMNRAGSYWFCESKTELIYSPDTSSYALTSLGIDPKRVIRIRREAENQWGELKEYNWRHFQQLFRSGGIQSGIPNVWAKYGNELHLDVSPNQNYSVQVYHFIDMSAVVDGTDTFLIPERDEDVLIDCCYQLLGYKIGRWDFGAAFQAMQIKILPLLADMKQDAGMPTQMPAAF